MHTPISNTSPAPVRGLEKAPTGIHGAHPPPYARPSPSQSGAKTSVRLVVSLPSEMMTTAFLRLWPCCARRTASTTACIIPTSKADRVINGEDATSSFGRWRGLVGLGDITGDGVGDFNGVTARLDYVKELLGFLPGTPVWTVADRGYSSHALRDAIGRGRDQEERAPQRHDQ